MSDAEREALFQSLRRDIGRALCALGLSHDEENWTLPSDTHEGGHDEEPNEAPQRELHDSHAEQRGEASVSGVRSEGGDEPGGRPVLPLDSVPVVRLAQRPERDVAPRRYCYPQCRDPWFNECADCWLDGGNPALEDEKGHGMTKTNESLIAAVREGMAVPCFVCGKQMERVDRTEWAEMQPSGGVICRTSGNSFPRPQRVYCTQWANCGWKGVRTIDSLGVQPKGCPKCGKEVTA